MSKKVFLKTSKYDYLISMWLHDKKFINNDNKIDLKYGENPNQKSYYSVDNSNSSLVDAKIYGPPLSYNNILDLDSGINCVKEFSKPTCVIIKHNNPCGVSSGSNINHAFKNALDADPISAFGGIVILNKLINETLANKLSKHFFEVIAATNFTKKGLDILKKKKKLI